jgi:hypothetical protein
MSDRLPESFLVGGMRRTTAFAASLPYSDALISEIWLRFFYFLARLAINYESVLPQSKLFNTSAQFTWPRIYSLGTDTQPTPPLPQTTSFTYDKMSATLTATLDFTQEPPSNIVSGIVVLGGTGQPFNLTYTNLNQPKTTKGTMRRRAIDSVVAQTPPRIRLIRLRTAAWTGGQSYDEDVTHKQCD